MDDLISRQATIEALEAHIRSAEEPYMLSDADKAFNWALRVAMSCVDGQPDATIKGYDPEHLALIAQVMTQSGVSAERAVKGFDDMIRVVDMVLAEQTRGVCERA